jgi:hypothetical protein
MKYYHRVPPVRVVSDWEAGPDDALRVRHVAHGRGQYLYLVATVALLLGFIAYWLR